MFARLFNSAPAQKPTLIETQIEFKDFLTLKEQLKDKELELKKAAGETYASLAYRKYAIIRDLLLELDKKIALYNNVVQSESKGESKEAVSNEKIIQFSHELHDFINSYYTTFAETLNQHRNQYSKNKAAEHMIDMSSVGAGLVAASLCATTIGACIVFFYASLSLNSGCKGIIGIGRTPPLTATAKILCHLIDNLDSISKNASLEYNLKFKGAKEKSADPEEFICPISCCLMEDPYKCKDGSTYEKTVIVRIINERKKSPFTNEPLTIDDIKEDPELRIKILEYRKSKPGLADPESAGGLRLI